METLTSLLTMMRYLTIAALLFIASCRKDPVTGPAVVICNNGFDSVDVSVFLVDYDTLYPYAPAAVQVNGNHFSNPYVVTRSEGITLDSAGLSIVNYISSIDTSFSFGMLLSGAGYPTEISGLRIDRDHETTMEVWSGGTRLAVFYLAATGFYDLQEAGCNPAASSMMCPTNVNIPGERFKVMTWM